MGLFKTKTEKELDWIIQRLEMNMSNNYKDNAQGNLKEFENALKLAKEENKIKGRALIKYETFLSEYQSRMVGYTHKDQKPYWT